MSVNQNRMKRISRSATSALTSSAVRAVSAIPADLRRCPPPAAIDGWPNRRALRGSRRQRRAPPRRRSVARDSCDEARHLFGFLALVEQRRHLPQAPRATFGDRVQHERLAPGGGGDVVADAPVEVGAGP